MLEGHEICEVKYSYLFSILDYRIESEYFLKKYQRVDKVLSHNKCESFSDIFDYLNGRPYSSTEFSSFPIDIDSIHVAKIGDVTNNRPTDLWENISNKEFKNQKGQLLVEGDILMTLTGDPPDVGKVSYIYGDIGKSTWNQRVSRITLKNADYSSCYAYILLQNEYCRTQIERYAKGIRQRNLGNDGLESVIVPILPKDIQLKVEKLVESAHSLLEKSKLLYKQAAEQMLSDLGLNGFTPHNTLHTTKRFCEFSQSCRLDAEYYSPKYDQLFRHLEGFPCSTIGKLVKIDKSIEPGSDAYQDDGIPFVRVQDLSKFGISDTEIHLSEEDFSSAIRPKKDTILLSKDGSVSIAYKVENDMDCITSSAILHLTLKDDNVLADYLTLVLNSIVVRMQAERDAGGSIIQHWKPSEIEKVIIPIIDKTKQEEIAQQVQKSFALRQEAKKLLDEAKLTVEKAILEG